tara:strand:- start:5999 stop:7543 length:1545 start_codon:yes stop_codon:yes gene_type:complete
MVEYFDGEYFDGISKVSVSNIDCLNNMTQDMANTIATGPQDDFFEMLSNFNREMKMTIDDTIDVTDKWNWRPGTYDKIDKFIFTRIGLNKKSNGVYTRLRKVREYANYLGYITNQADRLEAKKYNMKISGLSKNVNIEEFQESTTKLYEIVIAQCQLVKDMTNGKVILTPYINNDFANRLTPMYLDVQMNSLEMGIHQGNKCIQKIPLKPIHIVIKYPLRHYINKYSTSWHVLGYYDEFQNGDTISFPYIARGRYRNDRANQSYGTVCLDKYIEDVKKSFINRDYIQMAMHLMNWAQYYNTTHSNPYNNTSLLHFGLPKNYSKEYKATISNVESSCSSRIKVKVAKIEGYNELQLMDKLKADTQICNEIECQLKDTCSYYKVSNTIFEGVNNKTDEYCKMESMIGHLINYYEETQSYTRASSIQEDIDSMDLGYYSLYRNNYGFEETIEDYLSKLHDSMISYWGLTPGNIRYVYNKLVNGYSYYINSKVVKEDKSEEDIKQEMLAWATNPERMG